MALLSIYLITGAVYHTFQDNRAVRVIVPIAWALPMIGTVLFLVSGMRMFVNKRYSAFKSAEDLLLERIQAGRAERKKDAYDLFLPPDCTAGKRRAKFGILFYPGALVSHTSYTHIASELSDRGIVVVVLSLEPTRFVANLDVNMKMALESMHDIGFMGNVIVDEWVLAGHSAGAMTAMNLATQMKRITKVVLCGVGMNMMGNGKSLRDTSVQVLVVNGSEDSIVNGVSKKQKEALLNFLPPTNSNSSKGKTTYITIEGGNHDGFGHYGPQKAGGIRTIPLEEQQRIFVEKIVDFLSTETDKKTKNE